jgi:hypothetical protein
MLVYMFVFLYPIIKYIVVAQAIDPHHRERPGVDLNFDDESNEGHPDEVVHSMVRMKLIMTLAYQVLS